MRGRRILGAVLVAAAVASVAGPILAAKPEEVPVRQRGKPDDPAQSGKPEPGRPGVPFIPPTPIPIPSFDPPPQPTPGPSVRPGPPFIPPTESPGPPLDPDFLLPDTASG